MSRFLIFAGETYERAGGMFDLVDSEASLDNAVSKAKKLLERYDWAHVFDNVVSRLVYDSESLRHDETYRQIYSDRPNLYKG